MRVKEAGKSESHLVMRWIGIEGNQHTPTRKSADFRLVSNCKITYRTFKGGKANDDYE
jgi:hypothetical protein